jgi:hypothetical protein
MFEAITEKAIRPWNKNHIPTPFRFCGSLFDGISILKTPPALLVDRKRGTVALLALGDASQAIKLLVHDTQMICLGHSSAAPHTLLPYFETAFCEAAIPSPLVGGIIFGPISNDHERFVVRPRARRPPPFHTIAAKLVKLLPSKLESQA